MLYSEFEVLAKKAYKETGHLSNLTAAIRNLNYILIIALGKEAVPHILKWYQKNPSLVWAMVLREIYKTGPEIPEQHRGKTFYIRDAWIKYCKELV
jgi:hypothetical protein